MDAGLPSAESVADALWLGAWRDLWLVESAGVDSGKEDHVARVDPAKPPKGKEGEKSGKPPTDALSAMDGGKAVSEEQRRDLGTFGGAEESSDSTRERASSLSVDRPLPLPGREELARALRPLARRVRQGPPTEMDLEETILKTSAADGRLQVVFRPSLRRRAALDLILDRSRSMDLWRGLETDLLRMFEELGAFRRVTLRHLVEEQGAVRLHSPSGLPAPLAPDGGDRLVLVVSDTLGPLWRSGAAFEWMQEVGRTAMTGIVHLFPPKLQDRTALMPMPVAPVRNVVPFAPNPRLAWTSRFPGRGQASTPIPLFGLGVSDLGLLAAFASAAGGNRVPAISIHARMASQPEPEREVAAEERLRNFLRTADPESRRLLDVLALVPLVPEVMRLVQRRFAPNTCHHHLAEIVFGGLMRRAASGDPRPEFSVWYEFHTGVREALLQRGSVLDQLDVLDDIGDFLRERYASDRRFAAALRDPKGTLELPLPIQRVFARVRHWVYRSAGIAVQGCEDDSLPDKEKLPAWRTPLGMEFLQPPIPGTFQQGSPAGEPGRYDDEGPQHPVTLTQPFWLGRTPVTQGQWRAVLRSARRAGLEESTPLNESPSGFANAGDDAPVEQVSWDDVQGFLRLLNRLRESEGGPRAGWKFALPTESQWEYCCRAGSEAALYTGDISIRGANNAPELDAISWYGGNSGVDYPGGHDSSKWPEKQHPHTTAGTHPVGQKTANPWGFHDMIGNVWEWCRDFWGIYSDGAQQDPTGPTTGDRRVVRGGSWSNDARNCRSACRSWGYPGNRYDDQGFRLAAVPAETEGAGGGGGEDGSVSEGRATGPVLGLPLPGGVTLNLRLIPAGHFQMGSPKSEPIRSSDETVHPVELTGSFWLGESPVTQAQWKAVMQSNPSRFEGDNHPVENVSWEDAIRFCEQLTSELHRSGDLSRELELTLPTEAQWEYGCRAGTGSPFYFGSVLNGREANCNGNYPYGTRKKGPYRNGTTPVGDYREAAPHPWGLVDMHGNVWEWCWDWYGPYAEETQVDPQGPNTGDRRVVRGGSWDYDARDCRSACRDGRYPGDRYDDLGFRLAAVPAGSRARRSQPEQRGTSAPAAPPSQETREPWNPPRPQVSQDPQTKSLWKRAGEGIASVFKRPKQK